MLSEQEIKKIWKPFIVLFILSFLVVNWDDVSWAFNYRVVSGLASGTFEPRAGVQEIAALDRSAGNAERAEDFRNDEQRESGDCDMDNSQVSENRESIPVQQGGSDTQKNAQENYNNMNLSEGVIQIPKIGISAPLVFTDNSDNGYLHKKLDSGVVHYPRSALPGGSGQTIVLGHSAPANWPKIKYDWVFSNLNSLNVGDQIIITYNNKEYLYSVIRKAFLNKGEEMPQQDLTNSQNTLISVSCWPPGKDYKRIAVESELIEIQ